MLFSMDDCFPSQSFPEQGYLAGDLCWRKGRAKLVTLLSGHSLNKALLVFYFSSIDVLPDTATCGSDGAFQEGTWTWWKEIVWTCSRSDTKALVFVLLTFFKPI